MTSRERVLAAIDHCEPDRVPVDLGSTIMTGIMAVALAKLRPRLGLPERPVKVYEPFQMLGEVEPDVIEALGIDVLPIEPETLFFGLKRRDYKPWRLFDGTEVLVPGQFDVEVDADGGWVIHEEGDPAKPAAGHMPKDGFYFDLVGDESLHLDFEPPSLAEMEKKYANPIDPKTLEFLAATAQRLRPTGKALVFGAWFDFGPPAVGNSTDWLCVLASEPDYVGRLFELKTAADLANLERLRGAVGDTIDVFGIDGYDFGTQRSETFSPEIFERFHLPYYTAINDWVHTHTPWKTWKHCCGSIVRFLPLFVRSGLDCLNPMQTSAVGMEPRGLNEQFGRDLTFWGGGVDTQRVLPFGKPEEVYAHVKERLGIFAPGGGFVFNTVHNIQGTVPPENIAAMFQAVKDHGRG